MKKALKKFIIKYSYGEFKKENFKCILSFEEKNYENQKKVLKFEKLGISVIPIYGNDK